VLTETCTGSGGVQGGKKSLTTMIVWTPGEIRGSSEGRRREEQAKDLYGREKQFSRGKKGKTSNRVSGAKFSRS